MDQLEAIWDPSITHIIHLGAQTGVRDSLTDPGPYVAANTRGHFNILELTRKYKVSHLVYASSSSVYGKSDRLPFQEDDVCDKPVSLYAATKKSGELMTYSYCHLFGIKATGLRFFTVYGPWGRPDMAVFSFTKDIDEGKEIAVFNNGENKRSFTYVDDVVDGILAATFNPPRVNKLNDTPHALYNIGTTEMVSTNKLVELIEKNLHKKLDTKIINDVIRQFLDLSPLHHLILLRIKVENGFANSVLLPRLISKFAEKLVSLEILDIKTGLLPHFDDAGENVSDNEDELETPTNQNPRELNVDEKRRFFRDIWHAVGICHNLRELCYIPTAADYFTTNNGILTALDGKQQLNKLKLYSFQNVRSDIFCDALRGLINADAGRCSLRELEIGLMPPNFSCIITEVPELFQNLRRLCLYFGSPNYSSLLKKLPQISPKLEEVMIMASWQTLSVLVWSYLLCHCWDPQLQWEIVVHVRKWGKSQKIDMDSFVALVHHSSAFESSTLLNAEDSKFQQALRSIEEKSMHRVLKFSKRAATVFVVLPGN